MAASDDPGRVGYKRPPKHSQFRPGQSGNPSGRPKRKPSLTDDLAAELAEMISIVDGGRQLQVSKQRAIVKALVNAAMTGDLRAAAAVINLSATVVDNDAADAQEGADRSHDDELLEKYVEREVSRRSSEEGSGADQPGGGDQGGEDDEDT